MNKNFQEVGRSCCSVRFSKGLSQDPVGSRLSLKSTDGLETDGPDHASRRQNDRCGTKAQHMLYEGLGLARTLQHGGSCMCACVSEDVNDDTILQF